ncbi:MAG: ATPase F0F1 [Peptococcaceae bacterium BRH_c4b]|nr:MAG: ATPase F0F1 [Peptococcaceae bacterium BRH_c4b]
MADPPQNDGLQNGNDGLAEKIGKKENRKIRARQQQGSVWFGLGMLGMIGWSVAIPTLLGIALGVWIDGKWPGRFSWTLMLLVGGLMMGCANAWYWVEKERKRD